MPGTESIYERILQYLKGLLSNRQRHELEKEMMQDAFDEEAFEGLSHLPADDLESDMQRLMHRLDHRLKPPKTRNIAFYLRIAAAVLLLLGLSGVLYIFVRAPEQKLITQESSGKAAKTLPPAPQTEVPARASEPAPVIREKPEVNRPAEGSSAIVTSNGALKEISVTDVEPEDEVTAEMRQMEPVAAPEMARAKAEEQQLARPAAYGPQSPGYITGTIVGADGIGLAGVNVLEKGTQHGVISDLDGNFSIRLSSSDAELQFSTVGYQTVEMNAREIAGRPVTLQEDLMALEEVVVVGYATQKKDDNTGAVSRLESRDLVSGEPVPYSLVYPVPPGGTIRAFKNWVSERTDTVGFSNYPGKHRLQVILSILSDGRIGNVRIRSTAPRLVIESYRNAVAQSQPWTPARKEDLPVESEVVIRFTVIVE